MRKYKMWNGAMSTSAALGTVTTGTAIKTMLQLATPSTHQVQILGWGFSFDDPPGADGVVELIQTDVAATVTAHGQSGLVKRDPNQPDSQMTLSTSGTGFTSTGEGTVTATRLFDVVSLSSTSAEAAPVMEYEKTWTEFDGPIVAVSKWLRIRATCPTTAADMRCWIEWNE